MPLHNNVINWVGMLWVWARVVLFFLFLFYKDKVTKVLFLVYYNNLVKLLIVVGKIIDAVQKNPFMCIMELFAFVYIQNLAGLPKLKLNKYFCIFFPGKIITFSCLLLIHTGACFLADFEVHLLFLLTIFISTFAPGMNLKWLFA